MDPEQYIEQNPATAVLLRTAPSVIILLLSVSYLVGQAAAHRTGSRAYEDQVRAQAGATALRIYNKLQEIQLALDALARLPAREELASTVLSPPLVRLRYQSSKAGSSPDALVLPSTSQPITAVVDLRALFETCRVLGPARIGPTQSEEPAMIVPLPSRPHSVLRLRLKLFKTDTLRSRQLRAIDSLTTEAWSLAARDAQIAWPASLQPAAVPGFVDSQLLHGSPPAKPNQVDIPLPAPTAALRLAVHAPAPDRPTAGLAAALIGIVTALGLAVLAISPGRELGRTIRESRDRFRAFMDGIPDPVFAVDGEYRLMALNKAASSFAGCAIRDASGTKCYEGIFGLSAPCTDCRVKEAFQGPARISSTSDGPNRGNFDRLFFHHSPDQPFVVEYLRDRTAERELRGKLDAAEREAQMGRITATIAHDLRNPLVVIAASAETLKGKAANHKERTLADYILEETRRLDAFTRQLLQFSKPDSARPIAFELDVIAESAATSMAPTATRRKIDLRAEFGAEGVLVRGDPEQVRRILVNLLENGCHFAGDNGEIYLKTGKGDGVAFVQVEDSGPGIAEDKRSDIWRPFFTTRGDGTGLGLAISRRLAANSRGNLDLARALQLTGAAFRLELQLARPD